MFSHFIIGLTALLLSLTVQAQDNKQDTPTWHSVKSTQSLLGVLEQRSKHIKELRGSFIQRKHFDGMPMPLIARGVYQYSDRSGLHWVTESPIKSQLNITTDGISGIDNNNSTRFIADIFLAVIKGDLSQLERYFDIKSRGDSRHWVLRLTPSVTGLGNHLSYIEINGAEFTEKLFIIDSNGDRTEIILTEEAASTQQASTLITTSASNIKNTQSPPTLTNESNRATQ